MTLNLTRFYSLLWLSVLYSKEITVLYNGPLEASEWIVSVGDYVNNSFTALGSSDPQES